ncbi:neuferricin homolog [Eurosta solidaginis]|uniref:neuferricin homolog n=1 Tax=Eurosta solidaginis TaxID=178769 RepID=UPI0035306471
MFEFVKHLFKLQFLLILVAVLAGVYYNQIVNWIIKETGNTTDASISAKYDSSALREKLFTRHELAQFNGENGAPLYLAILGRVFDVTKGSKHYGTGCAYNFFVGRDASVSFINGEFEVYDKETADDVVTLNPNDLISLENWVQFYHKEYTHKGILIGRFYNEKGQKTAYHHKYLAILEQAKLGKAKSEQLLEIYPDCNIEWSGERGTHVWCTKASGGKHRQWVGYPRKLYEIGAEKFRCACVNEKDLKTEEVMLKIYDNCAPLAHDCYYKVD